MRDLLMEFTTFKRHCKFVWEGDRRICNLVYQYQYIDSRHDKRCHCNKRNCPVVKRTRL